MNYYDYYETEKYQEIEDLPEHIQEEIKSDFDGEVEIYGAYRKNDKGQFAKDYLDGLGLIDEDSFIYHHVDWESVADELLTDFFEYDIDEQRFIAVREA